MPTPAEPAEPDGPMFPMHSDMFGCWPGMTKREYFALHAPISFAMAVEANGGEPVLSLDASVNAFMREWVALKFMFSDAMLDQSAKGEG